MAPATLIDERIDWLEIEGYVVKAYFTNKQITFYASLYFDNEGKRVNFISNDRFNFATGKKMPWTSISCLRSVRLFISILIKKWHMENFS